MARIKLSDEQRQELEDAQADLEEAQRVIDVLEKGGFDVGMEKDRLQDLMGKRKLLLEEF